MDLFIFITLIKLEIYEDRKKDFIFLPLGGSSEIDEFKYTTMKIIGLWLI